MWSDESRRKKEKEKSASKNFLLLRRTSRSRETHKKPEKRAENKSKMTLKPLSWALRSRKKSQLIGKKKRNLLRPHFLASEDFDIFLYSNGLGVSESNCETFNSFVWFFFFFCFIKMAENEIQNGLDCDHCATSCIDDVKRKPCSTDTAR